MRMGVRHIGQPRSKDATVSAQLPQNRECPHGTIKFIQNCITV